MRPDCVAACIDHVTYMHVYNYGKKKTEQLLREQKSMKMLTNLHKIYSEW